MLRTHPAAHLTLSALLTACAVGPNYHPVAPAAPAAWETQISPTAAAGTESMNRWWTRFNDPLLSELVDDALAHNPDVTRALAAVWVARENRAQAAGGYYPELDGSVAASRGREIFEAPVGLGNPPAAVLPFTSNSFQDGFDASWEIDLFGRVRRSVEAADAGTQAAQDAADEVRLILVGDIARYYVDARGLQRRIAVTQSTIAALQDTARLTTVRYQAGTGTGLDAVRAHAQWQGTAAELPQLEIGLRADIYHLSILTGQPPGALLPRLLNPHPIPHVDDEALELGVPADVLRRRPDVREAERQLAEASANIGVAEADLYPALRLAGFIGFNSPRLSTLHHAEQSGAWSFGPAIDVPVFDAGRRRSVVRSREAQFQQAEAKYQTAVLSAEEDVENALVAYTRERERRARLVQAEASSADAVTLSTELYVKGLGTFLNVLDSQRTWFQAQSDLASSETNVSIDLIALYKALGGGWNEACCHPPPD